MKHEWRLSIADIDQVCYEIEGHLDLAAGTVSMGRRDGRWHIDIDADVSAHGESDDSFIIAAALVINHYHAVKRLAAP